jgi:hypothetical protein
MKKAGKRKVFRHRVSAALNFSKEICAVHNKSCGLFGVAIM